MIPATIRRARPRYFYLYRLIHGLVENLMVMLGKVLANIEPIEVKVFDEKLDSDL